MPYKDKDKQREYQRKRAAKARAAWLTGKKCVNCGATKKLEVDHIDPSQKRSHKVWTWSQGKREEELAKCQVLCFWCHKLKTHGPLAHGTRRRYRGHGCRCVECKAAISAHKRKYRHK